MRVARSLVISALVVTAATASAYGETGHQGATPAQNAPVPAQYQQLVGTLQNQVSAFAARPVPSSGNRRTVLAAGLIAADGNIGLGLLRPSALTTAREMLARLHAMGLGGVMLEVGFPLLLPSFPNSAGYTGFYKTIASMVHADRMTLSVELNPVFPNPQISSLHPDYSGLTVASYAAEQREEAQTIIDTMHPTYLTILDEPDTFGTNLGLPLSNPDVGAALVNLELHGLHRASTKVGAGTGTWTDPSYDLTLLAHTSIDYLSVHVYPLAPLPVTNLDTVVAAAGGAHRPVVMDETWLYKDLFGAGNFNAAGKITANVGGAADELKLDAFSFFEPVDEQFLDAMVRYDRGHGVAFVAPFNAMAFFAYVNWTPALDSASSAQVRADQNQQLIAALGEGTLTDVGAGYERLARG